MTGALMSDFDSTMIGVHARCVSDLGYNITNKIAAWLDVYKVVIESWEIHDIKGKENIQVIEIDAVSDEDYVAELI